MPRDSYAVWLHPCAHGRRVPFPLRRVAQLDAEDTQRPEQQAEPQQPHHVPQAPEKEKAEDFLLLSIVSSFEEADGEGNQPGAKNILPILSVGGLALLLAGGFVFREQIKDFLSGCGGPLGPGCACSVGGS